MRRPALHAADETRGACPAETTPRRPPASACDQGATNAVRLGGLLDGETSTRPHGHRGRRVRVAAVRMRVAEPPIAVGELADVVARRALLRVERGRRADDE